MKDPTERAQLARVFDQCLVGPVGYFLPLRRGLSSSGNPRWTSQWWFVRPEHLFLIPGDSSMGYRLPLESLPWTKPEDVPWSYDPDPFQNRDQLPEKPARRPDLFTAPPFLDEPEPPANTKEPKKGESSQWVARPAICIQPRDGKLFVFMPPVEYPADYLDLVAAIEDTATYLKFPVMIEGYTPPYDPRISLLKIPPDPGVIEVNLQPAGSWGELVEHTTELYELARQCRLGAEKFMIDGRHSGTGGSNHEVGGGGAPDCSALRLPPHPLRRIIRKWAKHPSLMQYFFWSFLS